MDPSLKTRLETLIRGLKSYTEVQLEPQTRLVEDLFFDSLELMNLILEIEREFDLTFDDDDLELERFETITTIVETVETYVAAR